MVLYENKSYLYFIIIFYKIFAFSSHVDTFLNALFMFILKFVNKNKKICNLIFYYYYKNLGKYIIIFIELTEQFKIGV